MFGHRYPLRLPELAGQTEPAVGGGRRSARLLDGEDEHAVRDLWGNTQGHSLPQNTQGHSLPQNTQGHSLPAP